jgi:glycosyltransferase involved in cell wall biosynthesis
LEEYGVLERFYYSHKIGKGPLTLGVTSKRLVNLWLKEYLVHLHGRLTGGWMAGEWHHIYAGFWERGALRKWTPCDIFHFMLDGASKKLIKRAQQNGSVIVGEAVTCHPSLFAAILRQEYEILGLNNYPRSYMAWEKQLEELKLCEYLLAPSRFVRDSFTEKGFEVSRVTVLPYGVDLQRFQPAEDMKKGGKAFRVICVGGISVHKGHIYLLEAWKKLGLRNAELLLIGSIAARMRNVLRRYDGLFRHVPFVPNDEIRHEYARSSVFVLPSLQDGCSLVCAEAMACGLPVITTVNNGAAGIVTHGKDGFVVPIRSPDAIAEHIEMLYRDQTLRQAMSDAALAKARNELGWDRYAIRLCDFYRSVLKNRGQPGLSGEAQPAKAS